MRLEDHLRAYARRLPRKTAVTANDAAAGGIASMPLNPATARAQDRLSVPGHTPPRATVQAALAKPEWKVEMVVTAALP